MSELPAKHDITKRDLARGRNLKAAAIASPIVLTAVPAAVTAVLFFFFATSPPVAASILFLGMIITALGLVKGGLLAGLFAYKHSNWKQEMREKIAIDGIKASEIDWFRKELSQHEKRALRDIERTDLLLGDAYRETLASRLTATRIMRSSRKEVQLTKRRKNKIRQLQAENAEKFLAEIDKDEQKLNSIGEEAKSMLAEAESRLQMIEAAALRGGGVANSELALKRLNEHAASLPLALEEAKMAETILKEFEEKEEAEKAGQ
ncbi:MAG: hypothetical protein KF685_08160 [Acidobacteria bacterium]|nr:hypothetical protein [Acidobacteriota bacterium]